MSRILSTRDHAPGGRPTRQRADRGVACSQSLAKQPRRLHARWRVLLGGSSSAASEALTVAPPSPVVKARDGRLLSAAALRLSKHDVAAALATASPDRAPAAVALPNGVAILAPADFCNVRRIQQSYAADDAAGAPPRGQRNAERCSHLLGRKSEHEPLACPAPVDRPAGSWPMPVCPTGAASSAPPAVRPLVLLICSTAI